MTITSPDNKLSGITIYSMGWKAAAEQLLSGEEQHSFGKLDEKEAATLAMLIEIFSETGPTTAGEEAARADAVFWAGMGATGALMGQLEKAGCDVDKARAALVLIYPDVPVT